MKSAGDFMSQSETNFTLGEDLYGVSVTELEGRVEALRAEIDRIEAVVTKKKKELSDAQKLFGG